MAASPRPERSDNHTDVLVVGAGISGLDVACHLARDLPQKSYVVLERRERIGGTWDLFRYPGIRSDSDMTTFAFGWRPWRSAKILADGESIRRYLAETAEEFGVRENIRFGTRVVSASWSTADGLWSVEAVDEATGTTSTYTTSFLVAGTGYYDYDRGYRPDFPGEERFAGTLVHPQFWPEDLDYAGKKVVIIGSGATAVTLVPAMAGDAEHVTMLQRSPTYVVSLPVYDQITAGLRKVLPDPVVFRTTRWRNIAVQRALYALAKARPGTVRSLVQKGVEKQLRGASDMANFTPKYDPWDQRLCFVPEGDLFAAIRAGDAEVVTDEIETFDETGVVLKSGRHLDADIVVTATGLQVQMLGGATLTVDGEPVDLPSKVTYKGVMIEDVPNAAMIFGYINASWTLKADIAAKYIVRLLGHMAARGADQVVVHATDADRDTGSVLGALNSGYVRRGDAALPRQGTHGVWRVTNDFLRDAPQLTRARIDDGRLEFSSTPAPKARSAPSRASA